MPDPNDRTNEELGRFRAYLETLTWLQVDPRLRGEFGFSDIVAKTLWEAYQTIERLREMGEGDQKRFLRRMLVHNLLDEIDRVKRGGRDFRRKCSLDEAMDGSSCRLRDWLVAEDSAPDARMIRQEEAIELLEALAKLDSRQREAIILQRYHGWTISQIAEHLGCTIGVVAGLHARGLRALRELLTGKENLTNG